MVILFILILGTSVCRAGDALEEQRRELLERPVYHSDFDLERRGVRPDHTGMPGYPPSLMIYNSKHENVEQLAMRGMPAGPGCPSYCSECSGIHKFFRADRP